MIMTYVASGLIGFAFCLMQFLVYSLYYNRTPREKATSAPAVHPLSWHIFKECESSRELVFGPTVPQGEVWVLTAICAKNNSGSTREINVAVYNGRDWLCLDSVADVWQCECAAWSGRVIMAPGWQLGCWFRGATIGDVLQCDAVHHVDYRL